MKPNIFEIATKELHQDAFITWLITWANDDRDFNEDEKLLNQCAKNFIKELVLNKYPEFNNEITHVVAVRQVRHIDIWAQINNKYLIIIEDKTNSGFHSDQLPRYKEIADSWCVENKYQEAICIYLKTGNESNSTLKIARQHGYFIFDRQLLLKVINEFSNIKNAIFIDFKKRLERLEVNNHEFNNKLIKDWAGNDWQGFFQVLEERKVIESWGFVNNVGGGFWNAMLNWHKWEDTYPAYIQLEQNKLCFKVSVARIEGVIMRENENAPYVRNTLYNTIIKKANEHNILHITKPARFRPGNYMTVAIVNAEYWLGDPNNIVDIEKVIENIKYYAAFFEKDVIGKVPA